MMNSSAMVAGSTMQFEFGEHRDKSVGSKIGLFGSTSEFNWRSSKT